MCRYGRSKGEGEKVESRGRRGQEVHEEREMKAEHQLPLPVRTPYVHQDAHTHLVLCADVFVLWTVGNLSYQVFVSGAVHSVPHQQLDKVSRTASSIT